jgi:phenylalanyl-tRNA synthetase beta chain
MVSIQKGVFQPYKVVLTKTRLDMYAGRKMNADEVSAILKNLEIEIEGYENEIWSLKVPLFKFDVNREEDVIEEVLRITGYDAVPYPKHLKSNIIFTDKISRHRLEEHIGASLQGDGFNEIMTNSISQSKYYEHPIMLLNSMTSELDCMRTHLLPGFLEVAQYNINRDSKDIKFYEFGNVYFNSQSYSQSKVLGILISGNHQATTWLQPKGDTTSYFHIKSTVESILNRFIENIKFEDLEIKFFNYGSKILFKKNEIGQMGEVSNEMKKSFDIKQDLFFAQINIDALYELVANKKITYTEISKFPVVKRDLALIVDEAVAFSALEQVCKKELREVLLDVSLFDVFKDAAFEGKKQYAIRLSMQDKQKTMEDADIEKYINKVLESLKKEVGATLR